MERRDAIQNAYRLTGSNSFYDGMITCSTVPGKAVCRLVWSMNKQECDEYGEKAMAGIPEKLTLWVKHNKRSIRIHNVGLGVEACFTCTGTAAYQHIQISAVLSSVQADGDILRQQLVFRLILVGIFLVDRTSRAPLGRSVLFSPSVIVLRGEIDADGDPVHQKQSEDSFYTVLTKLYLEWVLHHRSELLNQSGQSIL